MSKLDTLVAEVQAAIQESKLASVTFAHGFLKADKLVAKAYGLDDAEVGKVNDLLNRVNQSAMLKGSLNSVRATTSGRTMVSTDGSLIGKIIAQAMNNLIADSIVSIRNGEIPNGLYKKVVGKGNVILDVLDYRLASATIGSLGVKPTSRNTQGLEDCILAQVRANRPTDGRATAEASTDVETPVEVPVAA